MRNYYNPCMFCGLNVHNSTGGITLVKKTWIFTKYMQHVYSNLSLTYIYACMYVQVYMQCRCHLSFIVQLSTMGMI